MKKLKIGILRETKVPPDRRVAVPPKRAQQLLSAYPEIDLVVQPSSMRCFTDDEYQKAGIQLQEDLSDRDLLIGVKEVDINALIPDKTYVFFAHVAKEQAYNRDLLKTILKKNIRLLDYEYFTQANGTRLIAFGRWAGIVGAYNGLRGLGIFTGNFALKPAHNCHDRLEMDTQLEQVRLNRTRILVSGGGRVAQGAMETLSKLNIQEVSPQEYLVGSFTESVICRIDPQHYVTRKDGSDFDLDHFFNHPTEYKSTALPYLQKTDLYIAAHYWDPNSPRMFELKDLQSLIPNPHSPLPNPHSPLPSPQSQFPNPQSQFPNPILKVIADISCDINGSVPTTTHASTIEDPFYWYDDEKTLLMMTVDNLPGELPRDSSMEFSGVLIHEIIPHIIQGDPDGVIHRATITENGHLTKLFDYLSAYAGE